MTEQISYIPARIKNAQVDAHGNREPVAGAVDILDDDLQLSQAQINAIVLGGTISTGISLSKSAVFIGASQLGVNITATISTNADSIKIYKKVDSGDYTLIATGSGTSFVYTDNTAAPDSYATITYKAEFKVGDFTPTAKTASVKTTRPVYYGAGATYVSSNLTEDTTPHSAGSFDKSIQTQLGDHIYIEIPDNMTMTALQLVSTFNTPLAFEEITCDRAGHKAYRNIEERGAGTYTYRITITNN